MRTGRGLPVVPEIHRDEHVSLRVGEAGTGAPGRRPSAPAEAGWSAPSGAVPVTGSRPQHLGGGLSPETQGAQVAGRSARLLRAVRPGPSARTGAR